MSCGLNKITEVVLSIVPVMLYAHKKLYSVILQSVHVVVGGRVRRRDGDVRGPL